MKFDPKATGLQLFQKAKTLDPRKLLALPSPMDLGHSRNGLPSRQFSPTTPPDVYCWEDHYIAVRKLHPVKWFLHEALKEFNHHVTYRVKNFVYVIRCHVQPSYRFHMLDLRDPYGPSGGYSYGYADPRQLMLYAMFAILVSYVDDEMSDLAKGPPEPPVDPDQSDAMWHTLWTEAHELYKWWTVTRREEFEAADALYDHYIALEKDKGSLPDLLMDTKEKWVVAHNALSVREQDMVVRLAAIREGLWT